MEMNKIIYLDLDGVLVNFVKGVYEILGEKSPILGESDMTKWYGLSHNQFWKEINKYGEAWWADLERLSWADELFDFCQEKFELDNMFFLTSPSRLPGCLSGKLKWIQKHYPQMQRKVIFTPQKHLCAREGRILIDDTKSKTSKFHEYGGVGLLFPALYNDCWKLADKPVDFIKEQINNII